MSVIIPVYNVAEYLPRCIDSMLMLNEQNFEILLIDDGSKDSSGTICDEYVQKDIRIKVFHKSNGGVSSARNVGLDNARGDIVMFLDGDDSVNPVLLQDVLNSFEVSDEAAIYGTKYIADKVSPNFSPKDSKIYLLANLQVLPYWGSLNFWNILYRRRVIEQYKLRFTEGMKTAEDLEFLLKYMMCVNTVHFFSKPVYNYTIRGGSAINNHLAPKIRAFDHFRLLNNIQKWVELNDKKIPYWFNGCVEPLVKTSLYLAYVAKLPRTDISYMTKLLREIDDKFIKNGYNFFSSWYMRMAKFDCGLYLLLLKLKYKNKAE